MHAEHLVTEVNEANEDMFTLIAHEGQAQKSEDEKTNEQLS